MVLSNAERQRRFRQRLKAQAVQGVTPEMIERAARLMWEYVRKQEAEMGQSDPGPFDERLQFWRSRKGRSYWDELMPEDDDPELWAEFGADADLMAKVAAVVRAVRLPPDA
jgi:hypothetical protein